MKIFLILNESIGKRFLSTILKDCIDIVGTSVDKKSLNYQYFLNHSKKNQYKLFDHQDIKKNRFKKWLINNNIDLVLNIFSYVIIPSDIIDTPKIGFFNLHPGKLPEYSGLNPVSWSIHNSEKYHFITLHWLTKKIDGGPIAYYKKFRINRNDSAIKIMTKSVKFGLYLLNKLLKQANKNSNKIPKIKQNFSKRKYNSKKIPNDGFINWNLKANKILDFIRAFDYKPYSSFWLEPKMRVNKNIYQIIKVKISNSKCNAENGEIKIIKNKYIKISSQDKWIIILKIKYNNTYINSLDYFKNGDKIESIIK